MDASREKNPNQFKGEATLRQVFQEVSGRDSTGLLPVGVDVEVLAAAGRGPGRHVSGSVASVVGLKLDDGDA